MASLSENTPSFASRDELPRHLVNAFVAREDEKFFEHSGVVFTSVLRSVVRNIMSMRYEQGASTITMQLTRNVYELSGKSMDRKLLEMAQVFRIPLGKRIGVVYFSQVLPFLRSGLNVAIGLCWKSGVAAEVIGIPSGSVGQQLYNAKVYLETADLFCWTLVIVLLSIGCEKLLAMLMNWVEKEASACWKR